VLGVDRDSDALATGFDECDEAVLAAIDRLLEVSRRLGVKTGICGQGPSDRPALAEHLVAGRIDSISVSPDSFAAVKESVARAEAGLERSRRTGT
jgi:pyruvate,water dikinase